MIKVLIADDHAVVRRGLKQILAEQSDMRLAGEAQNGQEALDLAQKIESDVLVLDIEMPGISGLDVLKEMKRRLPRLPVVILSIYPEEQFAVRVLRAGASGYLTKESTAEELVTAIRKAFAGRKYVSASLADRLASELEVDRGNVSHLRLSDREFQVLRMIASGKTVSEIATVMSLSVKTVSTYRTRVLQKMGMRTNAEITHYAIEHRLVWSPYPPRSVSS